MDDLSFLRRVDLGDLYTFVVEKDLHLIKQELVLPILGGVFVLEGLSVMIQVASFKLRGKRVFKMAPLHHHFELLGWKEPKIVFRFLIVAILFALLSLSTLKLR